MGQPPRRASDPKSALISAARPGCQRKPRMGEGRNTGSGTWGCLVAECLSRTAGEAANTRKQGSSAQAWDGRGGGRGGADGWKTRDSARGATRQLGGSTGSPGWAGGAGKTAPRLTQALLTPRHFCAATPATQRTPEERKAEDVEQQGRDGFAALPLQ